MSGYSINGFASAGTPGSDGDVRFLREQIPNAATRRPFVVHDDRLKGHEQRMLTSVTDETFNTARGVELRLVFLINTQRPTPNGERRFGKTPLIGALGIRQRPDLYNGSPQDQALGIRQRPDLYNGFPSGPGA
jgi:hypothetical protein